MSQRWAWRGRALPAHLPPGSDCPVWPQSPPRSSTKECTPLAVAPGPSLPSASLGAAPGPSALSSHLAAAPSPSPPSARLPRRGSRPLSAELSPRRGSRPLSAKCSPASRRLPAPQCRAPSAARPPPLLHYSQTRRTHQPIARRKLWCAAHGRAWTAHDVWRRRRGGTVTGSGAIERSGPAAAAGALATDPRWAQPGTAGGRAPLPGSGHTADSASQRIGRAAVPQRWTLPSCSVCPGTPARTDGVSSCTDL